MDLRPVDLPRLRDDLIEFSRTEAAVELRLIDMDDSRIPRGDPRESIAADVPALVAADLFYVSLEMAELVSAAAASLPPFTLAPEDVPSRHGVVYFAAPVVDVEITGKPVHVAAVAWTTAAGWLQVTTCLRRDHAFLPDEQDLMRIGYPPIMPFGSWSVPVVESGNADPFRTDQPGGMMLAALKTLWLLMRQPLAEETRAVYDRASRRRLQREGKEPPPIRVIALRRPPGSSSSGEGGREWHHSWIVRGHWRLAAVGEGRLQRRPVWIAPYLKGPEGAPLLGGDKVYVVRES